jgi:hypothetical protein
MAQNVVDRWKRDLAACLRPLAGCLVRIKPSAISKLCRGPGTSTRRFQQQKPTVFIFNLPLLYARLIAELFRWMLCSILTLCTEASAPLFSVHNSMLSFCRPRLFRPSTWYLTTRSLRTRPKRPPVFVASWSPGVYRPLSPVKVPLSEESYGRRPRVLGGGKIAPQYTRKPAQVAIPHSVPRAIRKRGSQMDTTDHRICQRSRRIARLNHLLQHANANRTDKDFSEKLWKSYSLAKSAYPRLIFLLPDRAWDVLFATQTHRSKPERGNVQMQLYRAMRTVGKTQRDEKNVKHYWYLFQYVSAPRALKEWWEEHLRKPNYSFSPEFLGVGAKMYAYAGHLDRARDILEELHKLDPTYRRTSAAKVVFQLHIRSGSERDVDEAWNIYRAMKEGLGSDASLKDYGLWFQGFVEARQLTYAQNVFRAMIVDKRLGADTTRLDILGVLRRLNSLYRLADDIGKMTALILFVVPILPKVYHSHIFGDWMKSAVVYQAPEAAAQVLEMLCKRGFEPATFHCNLIISSLLRTGDEGDALKAENIAWKMVGKTPESFDKKTPFRDAVEAISNSTTTEVSRDNTEISWKQLLPVLPQANVETFALLMRHHYNKIQWEHVDYLERQVKERGMRPNTTLLTVLMDVRCRQGKYDEVWGIYTSLTEKKDGEPFVFPNGAAIRCLWKTLRIALDENREYETLPTPRELLKETVDWWKLVRVRHDRSQFKMGLATREKGPISRLLMHCFSYTQDLPGSLVALHVLRKQMNISPTDRAASILKQQVAWANLRHEPSAYKRNYARSGRYYKILVQMDKVYRMLMQERFRRLNISANDYAQLTKTEVDDMGLDLLSEFIRVVLKRQHPPEQVESMIDEVKTQIGLPNLSTGDMNAFEVA